MGGVVLAHRLKATGPQGDDTLQRGLGPEAPALVDG